MRVFWLRSVRRRPAAFLVLALVSLLATAAAVLSPLLLRAVQESAVARAVAEAGTVRTAVFGLADAAPGQAEDALGAAVAIAEGAGHAELWRSSIAAVETDDPVPWSAGGSGTRSARLAAVGADCGGLRITAGRCPVADGEVLVPASAGVPVGGRVVLREGRGVPLTATGVYDSPRAFAAGAQRAAGAPFPDAGPDLVVGLGQLDALQLDATAVAFRPLAHPFRLEDEDAARDGVALAEEAKLTTSGAASNGQVIAGIGTVLVEVRPDLDAAAVLLVLLALDAVGLAWFATAAVVQRLARARAGERGLARLRGLPLRRRVGTALLEPGIAVLGGAALGLPTGVATATALAPGPVDPLQPPVVLAAALVVGGSVVALVVSALTGARMPLADLLRTTAEPRRAGRAAVAVQVAVVLGAAVALYSLLADGGAGGSGGIALTAPVLLALLLGVAGARAAALLLGRSPRRAPTDPARLLAGRRLGRSPSVLTGAVAVLVGVAVATFAVQLAAASARAQQQRAEAAVGAPTVLTVAVPEGVSLRSAVAAADPSGRQAMAAAELTEGRDTGRLLAVDTARLAAVTTWTAGWAGEPLRALAARLAPRTLEPLVLTGTEARLRLADVRSGPLATTPSAVRLQLVVAGPRGWSTVELGAPRDGVLTGSMPCSAGCRVVALQAVSADRNPSPFSLDAVVVAIATDRQPAARFADRIDARQWRDRLGAASDPSQPATASVSAADDGLAVAFQDTAGGGTPGIAVRDAPEPVPVLLGPATQTQPFPGVRNAVTGTGLDQATLLLEPIGRAAILPRTLGTGALADLTVLERSSDPARDAAEDEVWLGAGASPAVEQRLRAAGVRVLHRETVAAATARFDRDAPALAAAAAPVAGVVGLLLVLLARLGGGLLDAPARRRDASAVRLAGVRASTVRRAVALEVAAPLAVAVVAGVAAGVAAFLLIAPHLRLTAGTAAAPPLDAAPALVPLGLLALTSLALCAVIAAAVGAVETRAEAA